MNTQYLSDSELEKVSAVLKKYGIDSPELRQELTDHYAEEIEEKMNEGSSFEEAFAEFKSENSWLKLRKLEFAYQKYLSKSIVKYVGATLKDLWFSPKVFILVALMIGIWKILGLGNPLEFYFLASIHAALALLILAITCISAWNFRKTKSPEVGYVVQVSFTAFYIILLPLWAMDGGLMEEVFEGVSDLTLLSYYLLVIHAVYLYIALFRRARFKKSWLKDLSKL